MMHMQHIGKEHTQQQYIGLHRGKHTRNTGDQYRRYVTTKSGSGLNIKLNMAQEAMKYRVQYEVNGRNREREERR